MYQLSSPYDNFHCITKSKLYLMDCMDLLWVQHSTWTGMAITSIVFILPNEEFVVARLLQNPQDFAKALSPFYGRANASIFGELLTEHLQLAAELIKAIMAEDNLKAEETEKSWYKNAREISSFLSSLNPYWSRRAWIKMFYEHLGLVKAEALNLINKDYKKGVKTQDLLEAGTLEMAMMMSDGIIRQFPYCFIN